MNILKFKYTSTTKFKFKQVVFKLVHLAYVFDNRFGRYICFGYFKIIEFNMNQLKLYDL